MPPIPDTVLMLIFTGDVMMAAYSEECSIENSYQKMIIEKDNTNSLQYKPGNGETY